MVRTHDLFSLEGKHVLLTGASGFLGSTMSRALLDNGARLVALGHSRLQGMEEQLMEEFGQDRITAYSIDMYDTEALKTTLHEAVSKAGVIDVLINNAHEMGPGTGFNKPDSALEDAPLQYFEKNFAGGMIWPVLAMQSVFPGMKNNGRGSIINTCTMYSLVAPDPGLYAGTTKMNPAGYGSAKAALMQLTRYAASFWGVYGIRVNAIHPGPFANTEDNGPNAVSKDDPFLKLLADRTCLGRTGVPRELIGALLFLASDASSYVTGQGISVDGGWTVR
jgi:NAD(P)-dependent dehydrogenase (short-subunit alcohol dehydrogenase family)